MEGILVLLALAGAIYAGYYFRTKKEASMMKSVLIGFLAWTGLALVAGGIGYAMMSDEEKAQMEAEQARKDSIEAVKEAEKNAKKVLEDKIFRARVAARLYIKDHLRDPDSYKEENCTCTSDSAQQIFTVNIKYRAKNGFGGMNRTISSFKVLVSEKEEAVLEAENL